MGLDSEPRHAGPASLTRGWHGPAGTRVVGGSSLPPSPLAPAALNPQHHTLGATTIRLGT